MRPARRQQIIDATRELMVKQGLKAVTLRRVAKKVGISAPSIYRHFENRDALVRAVMQREASSFRAISFARSNSPRRSINSLPPACSI